MVKNLPAVQETWVWYLGREDPQEDGMAAHSSILAWRIPWTGEPGGLQSTGSQRVRHDWATERGTAAAATALRTDELHPRLHPARTDDSQQTVTRKTEAEKEQKK